ncbi:MAG: hypothetical protein U0401_12830 [Anaerolineae bacterium]
MRSIKGQPGAGRRQLAHAAGVRRLSRSPLFKSVYSSRRGRTLLANCLHRGLVAGTVRRNCGPGW